ncbi:MAG: nitroreductase family protein [Herbinix sp.]|nr:nitroreductase family protein [Herbinix sp.]
MNAIFQRTSVRKYENKEIENEKIELLLKAAMSAPSAANQQPWEFYIVKDKDIIDKLSNCSPYAKCVKGAPVAIVNCYRKDIEMPEYAEIDLSACTENILLEAVELGLGAVWIGIAPLVDRMQSVKDILGIPDHLHAFAIIPVGYPINEDNQQDRYDKTRVHYK